MPKVFTPAFLLFFLAGGELLASPPGEARAEEGAAPRTAVLFFVSFPSGGVLEASPTEIRLEGGRLLEQELRRHGHEVPPAEEVEPLLQAWRVRSGASFSTEFLRDARARLEVDRILVANLALHLDRILLEARSVESETGCVVWAGVAEESAEPTDGGENRLHARLAAIARAAERVADGFAAADPTDGPPLLVLPFAAVGAEESEGDLATACLLVSLLREGAWRPIDPALSLRTLQEAGIGPGLLGAEGRSALRDRFGPAPILVPGLLSYGTPGLGDPSMEEEEGMAPPNRSLLAPFFLTLALVDAESGTILSGESRYVAPEALIGLFGTARRPRLPDRLLAATERLAESFRPIGGEE